MTRVDGAAPPPLSALQARAHQLGYSIEHQVGRARIEGTDTKVLAVTLILVPQGGEAAARCRNDQGEPGRLMGRAPIDTSPLNTDHAQTAAAAVATAKALEAALQAHDQLGKETP